MSHKFKKEIALSRQDAANRMIAIGEGLRTSGETTLELGGEGTIATVPDELTFELEVKDTPLEIELSWEPAAASDDEGSDESPAPSDDPGEQVPVPSARDPLAQ